MTPTSDVIEVQWGGEAGTNRAAIEQAKAWAKVQGMRVLTVKKVECTRTGDMPVRQPSWRVTLAAREVVE